MSRAFRGGSLRASSAPPEPHHVRSSAQVDGRDARAGEHLAWLRQVLRRRLGADRADDLAQAAWLRVEVSRTSPAHNPRGLLLAVAMNLARDQFRRERVQAAHLERSRGELEPWASDSTPEDDLHVRQVILELPAKLREVLLLSKIGGLTNREIAQRYGLSVRAVDKRLQKAITLFVARLRD